MMYVSRIFLVAVCSIALSQAASCMNKNVDMTPVAKAGEEAISRAFLSYTSDKLGLKNATKEKKTELVHKIIENIVIANYARSIGLHRGNDFIKERNDVIFNARMEYLCALYQFNSECEDGLMRKLKSSIELQNPEIEWHNVFIKKEAEFIPYGGKIPKATRRLKESIRSSLNISYTDTLAITTRHESVTLSTLLLALNDNDFFNILDSTNDERTRLFQTVLLKRYISNFIAQLPKEHQLLLVEIERRAEENLLMEFYREHIGFERLSGGKASSVRYIVTDDEVRSFYEKNRGMFEEPEWVEISHIRLKDYAKAMELKKKLDEFPFAFCEIARSHSIAADAANCGYIGIVKRTKNLPLFKEFAFTMTREDEISIPFLADGYTEIVKLHKRKTRILPLNDPHVRKLVIDAIQPIKREEKYQRTVEEWKRKISIQIFSSEL